MSAKKQDNSNSDGAIHHISDVNVWGGHPDKNYYVYVVLAFLGGLVGADHFYLRSYDTALKKLILNVCGLGIWYFWDIIQVMKDGDVVLCEGLSSPFDWIRGIGRGVFVQSLPTPKNGGGKEEKEYAAPKSYVIYTLLALFAGFLGADKFYMGAGWQGLAKVFSVFNIFLFLFGILWVVWDAVHALFMTESILTAGISPPMPYSWLFKTPVNGCEMFLVQEVKKEEKEGGWFDWLPTPGPLYKEFVVPLLQPTVGTAVNQANRAITVGTQMAALGTTALQTAPQVVTETLNGIVTEGQRAMENATTGLVPALPTPVIPALPTPAIPALPATQTGGAMAGPTPVIAGAFTALIVAGLAKGMFDYLGTR